MDDPRQIQEPLNTPPPADEPRETTRRGFLGAAGRKARYIVPLVVTLAAAPRQAHAYCLPYGSPCTANGECCSNNCVGAPAGTCQP